MTSFMNDGARWCAQQALHGASGVALEGSVPEWVQWGRFYSQLWPLFASRGVSEVEWLFGKFPPRTGLVQGQSRQPYAAVHSVLHSSPQAARQSSCK